MLVITRQADYDAAKRRNPEDVEPYGYEWHVSERVPSKNYDEGFDDVYEVQADGDELEYIRLAFQNLPIPTDKRVARWKGVMAQFIYDNLA